MRERSSSLLGKTLLSISLALLGARCGDVSTSREVAREEATTAVCDVYAMCGQIGSSNDGGAAPAYQTRASCETQWRGKFESLWTPASCDGKISQTDLDLCLAATRAIDCGNLGDVVLALGSCSKDKVCSAK